MSEETVGYVLREIKRLWDDRHKGCLPSLRPRKGVPPEEAWIYQYPSLVDPPAGERIQGFQRLAEVPLHVWHLDAGGTLRESSFEERLLSPQDKLPVRVGIIPYYPATGFGF